VHRVFDELAVDDIGQAAAQAPHRLDAGLAVGEAAAVITAAFSVVGVV
jgi:hypothetical protein